MKHQLHSTGDASRLAALLLPQIFPIFSVVAPCQPGASPVSVRLMFHHGLPAIRRAAAVACGVTLVALSLEGYQSPAPGSRARILLDEAHNNLFASAASGYRSFVRLVTDEGYSVATNSAPFNAARLATTDILLIANPNGAGAGAPVEQRARAAFADAEVDAVQQWIAGGGALLLITDHFPTGASARMLAERLGVHLSAGWTDDVPHRRTVPTYGPVFGYLLFSRAAGLIGEHPVMNGRDRSERIDTVSTTTGESLAGPPGSVSLLPLSPTALDWVPSVAARDERRPDQPRDFNPCPACDTRSAAGRSQGIAFELERGRVVVVGEMGVLNNYAAQTSNRQFALNIVRWLAREL